MQERGGGGGGGGEAEAQRQQQQQSSMRFVGYNNNRAKLHAVLVPLPTPGHINPMLKLGKILHSRGFHITFVLTDYTRHCLLQSGAPDPLALAADIDGFRFETVSDGLPLSRKDGLDQLEELGLSLRTKFPIHFRNLLLKLHCPTANNSTTTTTNGTTMSTPPVTCVIAGFMSSALRVADEFGILKILFWTSSACGFMGTLQVGELIRRGYVPLKDESCLTNGYLETQIEWIPGMEGVRLRDLIHFIRTTKENDVGLNLEREEAEIAHGSWGVILNTFDRLESEVVAALRRMFPRLYTLGSMASLADQCAREPLRPIRLNLWKEDSRCLRWLDTREPYSVVYVNFGSITVMTAEQLAEFAWGLAGSGHPFLWIIRPDLVEAAVGSRVLPEEFEEEARGNCYVASWCEQEEVLRHRAVGGFLTHAGWNSVLESICDGVPMLCWPFFAEQPTNCRYACREWGIAMEIEGVVRREQVEEMVRVLMDGEKGKAMRANAARLKEKASEAIGLDGSSSENLETLARDLHREKPPRCLVDEKES